MPSHTSLFLRCLVAPLSTCLIAYGSVVKARGITELGRQREEMNDIVIAGYAMNECAKLDASPTVGELLPKLVDVCNDVRSLDVQIAAMSAELKRADQAWLEANYHVLSLANMARAVLAEAGRPIPKRPKPVSDKPPRSKQKSAESAPSTPTTTTTTTSTTSTATTNTTEAKPSQMTPESKPAVTKPDTSDEVPHAPV